MLHIASLICVEHILSSDKLFWWAAVSLEDKCDSTEISPPAVSADVMELFEHEHDCCCCLAADESTRLEKSSW